MTLDTCPDSRYAPSMPTARRKQPPAPPPVDWYSTPDERRRNKPIELSLSPEARALLEAENAARGGGHRRSEIVSEALIEKLGPGAKKKRAG